MNSIKIIEPSVEILTPQEMFGNMLDRLEVAGRTCYQSEAKGNARDFVAKIIRSGHHSVLEHETISVRLICDRGVSHELVRHRLAAFNQESTRYCNYAGKAMEFIRPLWCGTQLCGKWESVNEFLYTTKRYTAEAVDLVWLTSLFAAANFYNQLIDYAWSPQQARAVLPNSLKTEIVMTANLREWRHVLALRTGRGAHPQIRQLMAMVLDEFKRQIEVVFDDIVVFMEQKDGGE